MSAALQLDLSPPAYLTFGRGDGTNDLVFDGFAGGGGASEAIKQAIGRDPDYAWNHDDEALCMHEANHPGTKHFQQNIWQADFAGTAGGRPLWFAWFSPDCKHFSKAKGAVPLKRNIRDLAWVVIRCIHELGRFKPRQIFLENVEEFVTWGPLIQDAAGNWVVDPLRKGETFRKWVAELRRYGYRVEWNEVRASHFGAPTIRKRLFLIARCDGQPIVWPKPTHGPGLLPFRTAANDCIDWSIACHSIFLTREEGRSVGVNRPLAEATMARIAKGVQRFVIDAAEPFIVTCNHSGDGFRGQGVNEPFKTLTAARDAHGLVVPFGVPRYGERQGQEPRTVDLCAPSPVVVPTGNGMSLVEAFLTKFQENSSGQLGLVAAFLAQHNTGVVGHPATSPVSSITGTGSHQALVASHLVKLRGSCKDGQPLDQGMPTSTAGGFHLGEVRSFMIKYYGSAIGQDVAEPLHSATTKPRFGLVMVQGEPYEIVDIAMRMLTPRELFRAQGFPESYIIDPIFNGKPLSKSAQNRMCGNSVSPPPAIAHIAANVGTAVAAATGAA
ncbi:MAG TPA: DNA cytosine methyltransferase [Aliidongia sp.]|uniref:DNA cytosine methyltransferase n=1 Tax=Aliidongia sp. TaxID=1914230 RepID=UPI002DDCADD3|nr:DNA cytosine methyltransferase [Aliidongia sp.]HEV2673275.1 DNA cytosine methyltransferase [Aliidongia sp.]